MRYGICIAAAVAALASAPAIAGPASSEFSSQGVTIEGPGVDFHVGPGHDRRDRWRHQRGWKERDVRGGGDCKTVTVRDRLPNGDTVTRTRSSC